MGHLALKVIPGAHKPDIKFIEDENLGRPQGANAPKLRVHLTQMPEAGRANAALEKWLTRLSGQKVQIISGHASRVKIIAFAQDENGFINLLKNGIEKGKRSK